MNNIEHENNNVDDEKHWNIFDNTSMLILYHSSSTSLHASHFLSVLLAFAMYLFTKATKEAFFVTSSFE